MIRLTINIERRPGREGGVDCLLVSNDEKIVGTVHPDEVQMLAVLKGGIIAAARVHAEQGTAGILEIHKIRPLEGVE